MALLVLVYTRSLEGSEIKKSIRRDDPMKKRLGFMVWVITVMLLAIPAIAHDTQEVAINEGALYTVTREVSLALAYTGLPVPTLMRLRNEGEEWPEWEPYDATKQWVLSEKDGIKTVYVETRYWAKVGWRTLSDNSSQYGCIRDIPSDGCTLWCCLTHW
jgi:hypothetical protein